MINISNKNISRRGIFTVVKPKEIEPPKRKKPHFKLKLKKFSFKKKETQTKNPTNRNKKKWIIGSLAALIIIVVGGGYGVYNYLYQNDPRIIYQKKLKSLTQIVSTQMTLPTDETPVTATVTDASKLPDELFFKHAEDGDKIIMYKKHKLAVLYRPSTGKVITEATLVFGDISPTPAPQVEVAGASTSAQQTQNVNATPAPTTAYVPQGKILVQPQ